jgi:hypothetical protein
MPPEQKCSPHGWTLDTLEKHFSSKLASFVELMNERDARNTERFSAADKAVAAALAAMEKSNGAALVSSEKAILKAEVSQEKHNLASNEIRSAMMDQQKHLANKTETDFRFAAIEQRLDDFKSTVIGQLGKIDRSLTEISGKSQGIGISGAFVVQLVTTMAALAAVVGFIMLFLKQGAS